MSNGSLEFLEPQLCSTIVQSYEGELDDSNIYCGKGELKSVDGSYEGMFLNGVFHGKGSYRWANDVTYEGDFQEGTITGTGTYTWPDGSTYRGEVRSGKRHGKGVFKCSAGQIYDGEWYNGYRHGSGTVSYEEGKSTTVYSGEWHMGKRQGYGKMRYASGNNYEGYWYADKKCGMGVMKWIEDQSTYAGEWDDDLPNGNGEALWANIKMSRLVTKQMSSVYRGTMKDGRKEGVGSFIYADGSQYSGEWDKDVKHGEGVVLLGNGAVESTKFNCGRRVNEPLKLTTDSPATLSKKKDATKKTVKGDSPSQVSAAGSKELRLNLLDLVAGLPVVNSSQVQDGDLPAVYVEQSTLGNIESELERIMMRYQAVVRKVYQSLTSSSRLESRRDVIDDLTGLGKGKNPKPSQFNAMDTAIVSSVVKHQAYLCTSLNRFRAYARELGVTHEAYSSRDLNKTYSDMLVSRFKSAEETYMRAHQGEGNGPVRLPKLHSILGNSIGPTDIKEDGYGLEVPIPELDFVNLLVRSFIESVCKKSNADKSNPRLDGEPQPAPMMLQEVVRMAFNSVQRNWEAKADLGEEHAAMNAPATQTLLKGESAPFFKNLWKDIAGGSSSVELREVFKFFLKLKEDKAVDADVSMSVLLDIIRGVKRPLAEQPTPETRPETAASEVPLDGAGGMEGEEVVAEAPAEEVGKNEDEAAAKKEPAPPLIPTLPPLAAMASFSSLTKHMDYEDFLEQLCLLMLSEKWIYADPATVGAPPAEEGGGGVMEEVAEEEKQESPEEGASTEVAPAEGQPEPEPETEPEPEPEKSKPEVLRERLTLFLETYGQAIPPSPVVVAQA